MHRKGFGSACEGWNMLSATGFFWALFLWISFGGGLTSLEEQKFWMTVWNLANDWHCSSL